MVTSKRVFAADLRSATVLVIAGSAAVVAAPAHAQVAGTAARPTGEGQTASPPGPESTATPTVSPGSAITVPGTDAAPPGPAATPSGQVEEVTVTARRRSETLIQTPISVTAFTAKAIEDRNISGLQEIAAFTPNLTLSNAGAEQNNRSNQTLIIRGMTPGNAPTTSVFIDGAPVSSGIITGLDDVARVEVLRGPQSATFGRTTFAGAINVVTKTPKDTLGGRIDAQVGTDGYFDERAAIEGPIIPGVLSARISGRYFQSDGQYRNAAQPFNRLGDQSTKSGNLLLYFTPTPGFRAKFFFQAYEDDDGPTAVKKYGRADYNCNAGAAPAGTLSYVCGTLPSNPSGPLYTNTIITPLFQTGVINNGFNKLVPLFKDNLGLDQGGLLARGYHTHLILEGDIAPINATLSSLTALSLRNFADITDYANDPADQTPNPSYGKVANVPPTTTWLFDFQRHQKDFSQEFRLTSNSKGRFRWLVGADYAYSILQSYAGALIPGGVSSFLTGNPVTTRTYAGFFSLSYDILSKASISFEGREQRDVITSDNRAVPTGILTRTGKGTYNSFIPRVIAQYRFNPTFQVYASYAEGVNPGTFNSSFSSLTPAQQAFLVSTYGANVQVNPEHLTNYEVGLKGRFLDGRLQLTLAAYHADWTNQIITQRLAAPLPSGTGQTLINIVTNAGSTKLDGIEAEGVASLGRGLTVEFGGAIAGSSIVNFACANCTALTGRTSFSGNQLPNYSKYSGTLALAYSHPISTTLSGYGRVDYIYKSGLWDSVSNLVQTQAANTVNFRVGVRQGRFSTEAFVTNAFNDIAPTSIENNINILNFSQYVVNTGLPDRRRFGLRLRYDY